MLELELQQYLLREYPQEKARCEWKEFKNLKNSFCGNRKRDTVSRGIKKMFNEQWRRHFAMPDYEIDQIKKKVVVRIYGNEINKRYTDLLKTNDTLSLWDCNSLDAVQ